METVLAWSIPGGTLSVVGVAVYELLRQRRRERKGTPPATTTVNEITAMFYGSKRMELDHRDSVAVMREEDAQAARRPALRCAAASDLVRFGTPGRAQAAEIAHAMAVDTTLPPTCRVRAAEVLAEAARSRRREALAVLANSLRSCGCAVPKHVRVHAARDLARSSEVFRDDARRLLPALLDG